MATNANYVDVDRFTIQGDMTTKAKVTQAIKLFQGVDGNAECHISAVEYRAGTADTLITVDAELVTSNLETVQGGLSYDKTTPIHTHPEMPASAFSTAEVAALQSVPVPSGAGDANKILGNNAAGTALEAKTLQGVTNRTSVSFPSPGVAEVGGPQDIHSGASPTFAGETLTGLTGIVVANGADPCGVAASSTQHHVLKRGSSGYEFGLLTNDNIDPDAGITESKLSLDFPTNTLSSAISGVAGDVSTVASALGSHAGDTDNPHSVTAEQVGAGTAQWNASKIQDVEVDDADPEDGQVQTYSSASGKIVWQLPPGFGGGEANTARSDGGGLALTLAKDGTALPFKTANTDQFEDDPEHPNRFRIKDGAVSGSGGATDPPPFQYGDANTIALLAGDYPQNGYRHRGYYPAPGTGKWTLAARTAIDIDGTYSAGVTSGMLEGASSKVASSYYYLFMTSAGIVLVLPAIRIKAITYSAPSTIINIADHATGALYADTFLSSNDIFNTYRGVKHGAVTDPYDGKIYTIFDTINAAHDEILITGDKTAELAAGDWLKIIPPSGVAFVELGFIGLDSSGNIRDFTRAGKVYRFNTSGTLLNGTKAIYSSPGNTELASVIPPSATIIHGYVYVFEPTSCRAVRVYLYSGNSGANYPWIAGDAEDNASANRGDRKPFDFVLTHPTLLRNAFEYLDTGNNHLAITSGGAAGILINGCEE